MKTSLNIFLLFLILCASCGSRKANDNKETAVQADTVKKFTLPLIPAMLNTPELRADYLVRHYWDNMDFTDTTYINLPDVTEQAWVDFIDILKIVPDTTAITAIKQMYKMADQKKVVFFYYTDLAEKYLYDPNSPMRNEELYIPVLDAMLESKVLNDTEKILPQGRRELAEQNRIGRPAEDFTYTLLSGKSGTLYGVKAKYTLLFINNPGCHACEEGIEELKQAPAINKEFAAGSLKILAVYPDGKYEYYDKHNCFKKGSFSPGDRHLTLEWKGIRFSTYICYDLRFPEWSRNQGEYDVAIYIANWPEFRQDDWNRLLRERAIENEAYVVAVNCAGTDLTGLVYRGESCVIAPDGEVRARCRDYWDDVVVHKVCKVHKVIK